MRTGLAHAPERRHEAAREQLQRSNGLERVCGEQVLERGQVERGGEAEEGEVFEEHGKGRDWESGLGIREGGLRCRHSGESRTCVSTAEWRVIHSACRSGG